MLVVDLLRCGIAKGDCSGISPSQDWGSVVSIAAEQYVLPLVYDAVTACEHLRGALPLEVKTQVYGSVRSAEQRYEKHCRVLEWLAKFYASHGIRMMVLKGIGLSALYPKPNHRQCGDIDIYIYGEQKRADELLERELGVEIDRTHHHHTLFKIDGVMVENHYDFVNVWAHSSSADIERELKELAASEHSETMRVGETEINMMPPTLGTIFLLRHTAQHFAAFHVELRQLVDWYLFTKHNDALIDWDRVKKVAENAGMGEFLEIWSSLSRWVVTGEGDLTKMEQRVLGDMIRPNYRGHGPKNGWFRIWLFKCKRWWTNRWKNRLVYSKESLFTQVWWLMRSHAIAPKV